MLFQKPLIQGKFLKRYKRFFADIEFEGEKVVAHVPNTGSLKSCNTEGSECLMSRAEDPKRALKFTLEAIKTEGHWVGVNTSWPNKLAVETFKTNLLSHWKKFDSHQSEVKINEHSRIDLALWDSQQTPIKKWKVDDFKITQPVHFIEIKNVTLKEGLSARFPDAVTERGQKHIQELVELISKGFTAEMLFIIQRTDIEYFEPAKEIDPVYARLLLEAEKKGLIITPLCFEISELGFRFFKKVSLKFS